MLKYSPEDKDRIAVNLARLLKVPKEVAMHALDAEEWDVEDAAETIRAGMRANVMYRIVNTDNFGGDYPNEKFVENLPYMTYEHANLVAAAINATQHDMSTRFFKIVPMDYVLVPGFEP